MSKERIMPEGTWPEEGSDTLVYLEEQRSLIIRATRQLLADFYRRNIPPKARVLEIGSGLGFLKKNLPPNTSARWIQLEAQKHFLELVKGVLPDEVYVCGSAYHLPFPDESMDAVCGFTSFDTFPKLNEAVRESYRVLKKGGLFFHLLDSIPISETIDRYVQEANLPPPKNPQEKHEYFSQILTQALEIEFGHPPKVLKLSADFVGRQTSSQRREYDGSNVFGNERPDLIKFSLAPAFRAANRDFLYHLLGWFSPRLAEERIGPTVIESSTIRCVKVKK